ncbi:MAG: glycosyl-4,4'-diaponeurosporenoate acyltransferase [Leptolinea sp.]|jgi:glycosyl-4,4'-diaponeurosporenoate acyltransferase|nr:glycosyl-4,4'-diaponeurosporenoate acyltransferase [Leptolinea sp.]
MRIFFLSEMSTLFVDIFAWVCFHLGIGYTCSRIPVSFFDPDQPLYLTKTWEKGGEIYEKIFHVRSWKKWIPSGARVYSGAFEIKNLPTYTFEYLDRWLKESCRAEFCHWIMIFPGFLFFLWNSVEAAWWMMAYAVANNMVPIIMQRYNRPRVRRMLEHLQKNSSSRMEHMIKLDAQEALSHSYQ